ncbi:MULTISPECIES: phytoene/squalene synthase family protein [Nesterenkonia]|uniref:Phytoene/squalene synthetase n=1 Tax=Nesterenkonia xinjiangensis TaxID=225327 RepID=A0A7Z0GLE0_9MICC|nr:MULTISPECIES: squalene/phytoene synthase family protein [Nesterenkonia]MDZ5078890.1 squalene/phytoene synthase family protein [Nesterenkonia sp. HG001]NYJ77589.1 phytoene/squalene synthetase [Nesterenkonia xinjiangensis]
MTHGAHRSPLSLYTHTAQCASSRVIREYSTSFGIAAALLPGRTRTGIRSIYALVRVADEIVDGTAEEAGLGSQARRDALDALETEALAALHTGFSTNLIVHAFAMTGRAAGIEDALVEAFFRSMRRDLEPVHSLSEEQYRSYVHGSAEVVGLMCLRVFLQDHAVSEERRTQLESGAERLGAAFQKINFLRDLGEDAQLLGRSYFPGTVPGELGEARKAEILADIDADLTAARRAIAMLPRGPRRATALAAGLFEELASRLRRMSAAELHGRRVSVPRHVKARILLSAMAAASPGSAG